MIWPLSLQSVWQGLLATAALFVVVHFWRYQQQINQDLTLFKTRINNSSLSELYQLRMQAMQQHKTAGWRGRQFATACLDLLVKEINRRNKVTEPKSGNTL